MEVTGITEKGWALVDRTVEKFKQGMNIEEIADSESIPVDTLRVMIATATLWEEKHGRVQP